eukprot:15360758-Ditylum_brightwellii.AAC.1
MAKRCVDIHCLCFNFAYISKHYLGKGSTFLAKVFNIASSTTLYTYEGAEHTEDDGAMWNSICIMAYKRYHYYKNKKAELGDENDFRRHGPLMADSFTI